MTRKIIALMITCITLISLVTGVILIMRRSEDHTALNEKVGTFSLNDYRGQLDEFASTLQLEPADDAEAAVQTAEQVWLEIYGDAVLKNKPYEIAFDQDNDVWLVSGVLHGAYAVGGVPYALIEKTSGRILAVWHTV